MLRLVPGYEEVLKAFEGDGAVAIRQGLEKLRLERERRPRPALDDKVLTSWNAMMISAYTDLYRATQEMRWLEKAERLASRIRTEMDDGQQGICHAWKDGKAYIPGFLEDYAQMALACIGLHQAGMDERWLFLAKRYAERALELFLDERTGLFWFSREDDATLVERKIETLDTVTPSSNAVMARVVINLGRLFEDHDLLTAGLRALNAITDYLRRFPTAHIAWAGVLADYHAPLRTLFISGPEAADWAQEILRSPDPFLLVATDNGTSEIPHLQARREAVKTRGFLCTFTECMEPVDSLSELQDLLAKTTS
ncbi:MAG: thioredoxin domain-containing protein [Bacteroidales bacterium]|nr:thioredoxin domain-containing protein [Bacteroidales bacterium]